MPTKMAKPDLARIAAGTYPHRSLGNRSGTRKQPQQRHTSYAYLRQQKWAKNKTYYAPGTGRGQGTGAYDQLEPMLVDSVGRMNMTSARGDEVNTGVPDIVIHPPPGDVEVDVERKEKDVEMLCARIGTQLGMGVEMSVLKEEGSGDT